MVFKICTVEGNIPFDALPVGKIIEYPLEEKDYRPFTQFQIALNNDGLYLKLWAFEVNQTANSQIKAILNLNPLTNSYIELTVNGDYSVVLASYDDKGNKTICDSSAITIHRMDGEDLQGIYWGATILVSQEIITKLFGKLIFNSNSIMMGNFFKINEVECPHYGCYFPIDFKAENPYGISSLREIPIFVY